MSKRVAKTAGPAPIGKPAAPRRISFNFAQLDCRGFKKLASAAFLARFMERLRALSEHTWAELDIMPRHGLGYERIPLSCIKPRLPRGFDRETDLLAFRATGDNLPFVGYRDGDVFNVLFVETRFGEVYEH